MLQNGYDYLKYQEYERALKYFREAETRKKELSPAEQKALARGIENALRGTRESTNGSGTSYARSGARRPGAFALARPGQTGGRTSEATRDTTVALASRPEIPSLPVGSAPMPAQAAPPVDPATSRAGLTAPVALPPPPVIPDAPAIEDAPPPASPNSTPAADPAPPASATPVENAPTPLAEPSTSAPTDGTPTSVERAPTPLVEPRPAKAPTPPVPGEAAPTPVETAPTPIDSAPTPIETAPAPADDAPAPVVATPISAETEAAPPAEAPPASPETPADPKPPTSELESIPLPSLADEPPASTDPATPATAPVESEKTAAPPAEPEKPAAPEAPNSEDPNVADAPAVAPAPAPEEPKALGAPAEPMPSETPDPAPAEAAPEPAASAPASAAPAAPREPVAGTNAFTLPPLPEDAPPAASAPGATRSVPATRPSGALIGRSTDNFIPSRPESIPSTLSEKIQKEVDEVAARQDEEMLRDGVPGREPPPTTPGTPGTPGGITPSTRLEIARAPSPTEARPIRAIPVPDEFTSLPPRVWEPNRKYWAAAATCHMPLYFQDAALERYGHSTEQFFGTFGRYLSYPVDDPRQSNQRNQITQPMFSAGLFLAQIALLPYNLIVDPPWEAEYDLGYHRPGDRIPTDSYYLPLTGVGPPGAGAKY
jgi:hypothetical protein